MTFFTKTIFIIKTIRAIIKALYLKNFIEKNKYKNLIFKFK
jgi:hypothetical protein